MTEREFFSKFHGVRGPKCAGAPYPAFDPAAVNESRFPHKLRFKEESFAFKEGDGFKGQDVVEVDWFAKESHSPEKLIAEVKRCLAHIGFVGQVNFAIDYYDGDREAFDGAFILPEAQ